MQTRTLTGWLLTCGPIGMFLIWGILEPLVIGSGATPTEALEQALANETLWVLFGILGSLSFISLFVGLSLLSISLRGDGPSGNGFAAASTIMFAALTAIGMANTGLSIAAVGTAKEQGVPAGVPIEVIGNSIGSGFGLFFGVAAILLGVTIAAQKAAPAVLGWLFALVGVILFLGTFIPWDDTPVPIVAWLAMTITVVGIGITTLRAKEAS